MCVFSCAILAQISPHFVTWRSVELFSSSFSKLVTTVSYFSKLLVGYCSVVLHIHMGIFQHMHLSLLVFDEHLPL